jgi:hypothetical protein
VQVGRHNRISEEQQNQQAAHNHDNASLARSLTFIYKKGTISSHKIKYIYVIKKKHIIALKWETLLAFYDCWAEYLCDRPSSASAEIG